MIAHDSNDSNDAMFFSSIEKVLSGYQRRQALCNAPHMIHKTKKVFLVYVNNRRVTARNGFSWCRAIHESKSIPSTSIPQSSLAHRGILGSLSTALPLPVTGNFHNGQTMCHSAINLAKTCRISHTKACLGYILVKFLALTRITSPGKNLINTRSDPSSPQHCVPEFAGVYPLISAQMGLRGQENYDLHFFSSLRRQPTNQGLVRHSHPRIPLQKSDHITLDRKPKKQKKSDKHIK